MALATADLFAAFDVTDGAQERDISPVLEDAIYYDLNLMGSMNVDFGNPVEDIIHYWNEEELNPDTVTLSASATSTATALSFTSGHGSRLSVGDLLYNHSVANSTELIQVTATAADAATVVRTYNSTVAASISTDTLAVIRAEQEGSNIGADRTLNPTVRNNHTQIFAAKDLLISGSQLARKMATNEYRDFLARQLAARAVEMKIGLTRAALYSEKSASVGSDTVYRTFAGIRSFINNGSGVSNASSEALSLAVLNLHNKSAVDKGVFPDKLIIGTDLVGSVTGIDSTVRRLRESDKQVGYTVQEVLLAQGNMVEVVVDSRVKTGDAFLITNEKVRMRPLSGRGMFVIAATDFADARTRRLLGEWTLEYRNPQAGIYLRNKT
jgi:hypothetical protein